MTVLYSFNLSVEVEDVDTLFNSALNHTTQVDGLTPEEAREILLDDGKIDVGACLQALFDPGVSPAGTAIVESEAVRLTEY